MSMLPITTGLIQFITQDVMFEDLEQDLGFAINPSELSINFTKL